MKRWLILGGLLCLLGGLASASIIPTFTSQTGGGSLFTYNYTAALDSLQTLVTGNQLCFADIFGLTGSPSAPIDWTAVNRPGLACPINAGTGSPANVAPSVLYTYTGSATVDGPAPLGNFSFQSTGGSEGLVAYGAVAQKTSDGKATANQGTVLGPAATPPVPEPQWSALLLGLGILAFAGVRRKRLTQ